MKDHFNIIGISGAHGSGKSTLVQDLSKILLENKIQFEINNLSLSESSMEFDKFQGVRSNQTNSYNFFKNQYYCGQIVRKLISNFEILDALSPKQLWGNKKMLYITDRTPLDQLSYTVYFYLHNKFKYNYDHQYYSDQDSYILNEYLKSGMNILNDQYKYTKGFSGSEEQLLVDHMDDVLNFCNNVYDALIIPNVLDLDKIENNTGFRDHSNKKYQQIVNIIYNKLQDKLTVDKFRVDGSREERQQSSYNFISFKFDTR